MIRFEHIAQAAIAACLRAGLVQINVDLRMAEGGRVVSVTKDHALFAHYWCDLVDQVHGEAPID